MTKNKLILYLLCILSMNYSYVLAGKEGKDEREERPISHKINLRFSDPEFNNKFDIKRTAHLVTVTSKKPNESFTLKYATDHAEGILEVDLLYGSRGSSEQDRSFPKTQMPQSIMNQVILWGDITTLPVHFRHDQVYYQINNTSIHQCNNPVYNQCRASV